MFKIQQAYMTVRGLTIAVLLKQHRNAMIMDKSQLLLSNFTQKPFFSLEKKQQKKKRKIGMGDLEKERQQN